MNRQQAAIKIAKVNRFIKQMNYWSELGENIHPAAFGDDIYSMSTWVKEIQAYLRTDKNFLLLADLIECVGDISVIDEYVSKRNRRMEEVMRQSLIGISRNMKALLAVGQELRKESKGSYSMLPDPLYNETAIELLERAVKADILDNEFQPSAKANYNHLKIVAYAVSQIMQFDKKHTYCYFEAMWHKRLSPVMLPSYKKESCEETMGLYPEVDFTPILEGHESLVFNCPFGDERKDFLRRELAKHGYIGRNTTAKQFFAIFDKDKFKTPVNWLKEQRQLGVFAKLGLGPTNNKNLWLKTITCFTVNGKRPHKGSLSTGSSLLERTGVLESYDAVLTAICKTYNTEANCCVAGNTAEQNSGGISSRHHIPSDIVSLIVHCANEADLFLEELTPVHFSSYYAGQRTAPLQARSNVEIVEFFDYLASKGMVEPNWQHVIDRDKLIISSSGRKHLTKSVMASTLCRINGKPATCKILRIMNIVDKYMEEHKVNRFQ